MKVCLIARGEHRGLGTLTREWFRHMAPDGVILMVPPHDLDVHGEWYQGTPLLTVPLDSGRRVLPGHEASVRKFIGDHDVLYSAETFYDWRICEWAREAGTATVCHVMPEYWLPQPQRARRPDRLWLPTGWRATEVPGATRVPVPVVTRWPAPEASGDEKGRTRWLHVGGAKANGDRNGTKVVIEALQHLRGRHVVTIATQHDEMLRTIRSAHKGPGTTVRAQGETATSDELYAEQDAMVFPRRYGGLSLPAHEAMAAGLALVMSNVEPQRSEWPIIPVPAHEFAQPLRTMAGRIPLATIDARALAEVMDAVGDDRARLQDARAASYEWAQCNSWAQQRAHVEQALRDALR